MKAELLGEEDVAGSVTVVAKHNGVSISPNKYMQDNMFSPPEPSRSRAAAQITFKFDKPGSMEPHTIIVHQSDLPKTGPQVENCKPCQTYATPHLKNPKAPPDQNNPIVHRTLNKGKPDSTPSATASRSGSPESTRASRSR